MPGRSTQPGRLPGSKLQAKRNGSRKRCENWRREIHYEIERQNTR